jgi:hypothetical protein
MVNIMARVQYVYAEGGERLGRLPFDSRSAMIAADRPVLQPLAKGLRLRSLTGRSKW